MTHALIVRRDAAEATLGHFVDKPFVWGTGDCAKMLVFHLREMGKEVRIAAAGSYSTALGAKRALRRMGIGSLAEALDARFPRIAPARAIMGDVVALPSTGSLDSIFVAIGNDAGCGYLEGHDVGVAVRLLSPIAAWRVDP